MAARGSGQECGLDPGGNRTDMVICTLKGSLTAVEAGGQA